MSTRDPYPVTWELPAALMGLLMFSLGAGLQLGRSVACWASDGDWLWPEELVRSAVGIVRGHVDAGLAAGACSARAGELAGYVIVVLLVLLGVVLVVGREAWLRWGTQARAGYASAEQARQLLGLSRLRRVRRIIRPDLSQGRR